MAATTYTHAQLAAAGSLKRQAVQWHLRNVEPATREKPMRGNFAAAWTLAQLPPALWQHLSSEASRQNCRGINEAEKIQTLLAMPRTRWQPPLALDKICDHDLKAATKLREALSPWLIRQHDPKLNRADLRAAGLNDYQSIFGNRITPRYWDGLFARTVRRDRGFEDWNNLALYLPECPKAKAAPADVVSQALAADFADLENFINGCGNPHDPTKDERAGLWKLALVKHAELIRAGQLEKSAGRRVREFLFARAPFLSASRDALRKVFEQRLANGIADLRAGNGDRAEYPSADIRRVRHSAVRKNGNRIDAAWREEYPLLSEYTRQRHPGRPRKCPRAFYQLVNREKVDALYARTQGKRPLRKMVGSVTRNATGIPAMARWAMDDWTSNIQVVLTKPDGSLVLDQDGKPSLIQPQIITVMDFASRKWVGWAMSTDKGPTAELVCEAATDGFRRHGVPRKLFEENGFVFKKSLNVNGKADDQGRMIVAGLAQYGCTLHNFEKMSPTSKGELEKSFDLIQRLMERHPGYAGRLQILDASEDFKREERLIRSGKLPADKIPRHTYAAFFQVMRDLIAEYNATPQHGHLNGLCPNEAFEVLKDPSNPPIQFDTRLEWMLANEKYIVTVGAGGVRFRHYGRKIEVRGGELPQHVGEELRVLVPRRDPSMVTFMSLDFRNPFTVETCQQPSADESRIVSGSSVLGRELGKIAEHMRAVDTELKDLTAEFGNPRHDLLAQYRAGSTALADVNGTTRRVILNARIESSVEQMHTQRAAIKADRREKTVTKNKAVRAGIPVAMVRNDARSRRAIELAEEAASEASRFESSQEIEP